jgi:hypothetical protein
MQQKSEDIGSVAIHLSEEQPVSKYDRLIARAKQIPPVVTVVVHPCDETSLRGATEAAELGIISPILVKPAAKIGIGLYVIPTDEELMIARHTLGVLAQRGTETFRVTA